MTCALPRKLRCVRSPRNGPEVHDSIRRDFREQCRRQRVAARRNVQVPSRFTRKERGSAEKLSHNLAGRGDDRRRDVRGIEQERETFVIDRPQMRVAREQD